jgi:hypothetical protein
MLDAMARGLCWSGRETIFERLRLMATNHTSIRATAFSGTPDVQWERMIKSASRRFERYEPAKTKKVVLMLLMFVLAVAMGTGINELRVIAETAEAAAVVAARDERQVAAPVKKLYEPIIADENWKRFNIVEGAPAVLQNLKIPNFSFQNQNLPVARVDGVTLNGKLPAVIWLKLEQPGNTVLLVDTDHGVYVRFMEEVSPGFVSRCKISPYNFGTVDGKPADIDIRTVRIKNLWVIQDADATGVKSPGWIAVSEPVNPPEPIQVATR